MIRTRLHAVALAAVRSRTVGGACVLRTSLRAAACQPVATGGCVDHGSASVVGCVKLHSK